MNYICLYSKAPIPGQAKTRLAKSIGPLAAAELARAMLIDNCDVASNVDGVRRQIWYPPENSINDFSDLMPKGFTLHRQKGTGLGERMSFTFKELLKNEGNKAIIIGCDCITHTRNSITSAFKVLESSPLVLQPSTDGGYVLIGQSFWNPNVFIDIDWGSNSVFEQTMQKIAQLKVDYELLPTTFDIDRIDDLSKVNYIARDGNSSNTIKCLKKNGLYE